MSYDPKQRKQNIRKFMVSMLDHVDEAKARNPGYEFLANGPDEGEIARRSGLDRAESDEISDKLHGDDWIAHKGSGNDGRICAFTSKGIEEARQIRYDDSGLAGRRRLAASAQAGGRWLLLKMAAGIVAVSTPIIIIYRDQIIGWIKIRLGL